MDSKTDAEMTISLDTVRHISRLVRISLDEAETERFREDLSRILDWVHQLESVDTDALPPFSDMGGNLLERARDDSVLPVPAREELLANAPQSQDGCFAVPRILE